MTANTPPPGNLPIQGVSTPGSQNQPRSVDKSDGKSGVAFRALIDRLQEQANELSRESDAVAGPEELAGAVEKAGESLRDALSAPGAPGAPGTPDAPGTPGEPTA